MSWHFHTCRIHALVEVVGYHVSSSGSRALSSGPFCEQRDHECAVAELIKEQKAEKEILQTQIEALKKLLASERKKFEERPARPQDLQAIDSLTKALKESNVRVNEWARIRERH